MQARGFQIIQALREMNLVDRLFIDFLKKAGGRDRDVRIVRQVRQHPHDDEFAGVDDEGADGDEVDRTACTLSV
jgi:hypothetical protein